MSAGRECPACGTKIAADRFACREHWFMLPGGVRLAINMAFRRYSREPNEKNLETLREAQAMGLEVLCPSTS